MRVVLDLPPDLAAWLTAHAGRRSIAHVIVTESLPVHRAVVAQARVATTPAKPRSTRRGIPGGKR